MSERTPAKLTRREFCKTGLALAGGVVLSNRSAGALNETSPDSAMRAFRLVDAGVPCSTIVVASDADAYVRHAVDDLVDVVTRMSGAALPVVEEGVAPGTAHVEESSVGV